MLMPANYLTHLPLMLLSEHVLIESKVVNATDPELIRNRWHKRYSPGMFHNKQDRFNMLRVLNKSNEQRDLKNMVRTQGTLLNALW